MYSGLRLGTYSNKQNKYTNLKHFVHYCSLFFFCAAFYCSLEIRRQSYRISFYFNLKAATRDNLTLVSHTFSFSLQHSVSEVGLIAYLTLFLARFLPSLRRDVGKKKKNTLVFFRKRQIFKTNYQHMILPKCQLIFPTLE